MKLLLLLLIVCCLAAGALAAEGPTICIDPGHPSEVGRGTHGKKYTEIEVAWKVALVLKKRLEEDGYRVVLTKSSENELVRNKRRAEIANDAHSALMVRLHCDAEGGRGIGTYYPSQQGVSEGVRGPSKHVLTESRESAEKFHRALVASLADLIPDRGLMTDLQTAIGHKQGALTGSVFSKVPVLLVEMLVLTNPKDEAILSEQDGFNRLAEALEAGVKAAVPIRRA